MLEAARERGLEGIVAKRAGSRYAAGRSPDWVKVKIVNLFRLSLKWKPSVSR